jgi:ribosomal protein S18 acetylase RimI-like enzyme
MSHDNKAMGEIIEIPWSRGPLRLRPERDDDRAFRLQLFRDSRPELAMLPLPPQVCEQIVQHQFQAQTVSYRTHFPRARFDIIELDGGAIGRIVVDRPGSALHIIDQAITPAWRNLGLGTTIMRWLMEEAAGAGLPVRLMVFSGNDPSRRLYNRLGFVPIGETPTHIELEWRAGSAL